MPRSRPLALVLVAALVAAATASTANATSTATTSALPASPAETASTAASTSPASASAPSDAQPKPRVRARDVGSGHRFVRRASAPRGLSSGIGVRRRCGCVGPTSYGKEHDQLTSLSYYGFRYYDRLTLTWTQADPLYRFIPELAWDEPRRANPYSFVLNNPLKYYDPDGRDGSLCGGKPGGCYDEDPEADEELRERAEKQKRACAEGECLTFGEFVSGIIDELGDLLGDNPANGPELNDDGTQAATYANRSLKEEVTNYGMVAAAGGGGKLIGSAVRRGRAAAAKGGGETVTLYRAVKAEEAADIAATKTLRNPAGVEVKYFSTSAEGAAKYGKQANRAWPAEGPYQIVQTAVQKGLLGPEAAAVVDRGIQTVVLTTEQLKKAATPILWNRSPIPK